MTGQNGFENIEVAAETFPASSFDQMDLHHSAKEPSYNLPLLCPGGSTFVVLSSPIDAGSRRRRAESRAGPPARASRT